MSTSTSLSKIVRRAVRNRMQRTRLARTSSRITWTNWAHTQVCHPVKMYKPDSVGTVCTTIDALRKNMRVKVVGSGHSPSDIACCSPRDGGAMMSLENLSGLILVNAESDPPTVTVQGGMKLSRLNEILDEHGLSLSVLGSITDQTIAGAISTGTHGTGMHYGCLASYVEELEIVTAGAQVSDVIKCNKRENSDIFYAALCGLGALGVIVSVKLRVERAFYLKALEEKMRLHDVIANFGTIRNSAQHVRIWWFPHTDDCIVWRANRTYDTPPPAAKVLSSHITELVRDRLIGVHFYEFLLYCSSFMPALVVPPVNRAYARWMFAEHAEKVDVSHRAFTFDCKFKQHVNEWAVPVDEAPKALSELQELIGRHRFYVHFPVEIRFAAADDIWLSPAYGQAVCWIGIIMYRPYGKDIPFERYFAEFERMMARLGGRPHWAKAFGLRASQLRQLYPKWDQFVELRNCLDPHKIFWNAYLERVLGDAVEDEQATHRITMPPAKL